METQRDDSRPIVVHAGNLDAVDFVGLAISASLQPERKHVAILDASLPLAGPSEVWAFDPRLAVPRMELGSSPDGTIRQLVTPLADGRFADADRTQMSSGHYSRFIGETIRRAYSSCHSALPNELAGHVVEMLYDDLRIPNVRVEVRRSRFVGECGPAVVEVLEDRAAFLDDGETLQLGQGSAVQVGHLLYRHLQRENSCLYLSSAISRMKIDEVDWRRSILRGPLDAVLVAERSSGLLGHRPWFLECGNYGPESVEVVRSLFRKSGSSHRLGEPTGVLLTEYAMPGSGSLLGSSDWVVPLAVHCAALGLPVGERWAWSTRAALMHAEAVPRMLTSGEEFGPFSTILSSVVALDHLARKAWTGTRPLPNRATLSAERSALHDAVRRLKKDLAPFGQLAQVQLPDGSSLETLRRRLVSSGESAQILAELGMLRAIARRLLRLVLCAAFLVADTLGRVSLPVLAWLGPEALASFTSVHDGVLSKRLSDIQLLTTV